MMTCGEYSIFLYTPAQIIESLRYSNNSKTIVLPCLNIADVVYRSLILHTGIEYEHDILDTQINFPTNIILFVLEHSQASKNK